MIEDLRLTMQDKGILREFGTRVKALRKQRRWTQKELASKVGVRSAQLNKYECGYHAPPVDRLIRLAELLDTTVDYLLSGEQTEASPLRSCRLLDRFRALEQFEAKDLEAVITLIDALIVKRRVEGVMNPFVEVG